MFRKTSGFTAAIVVAFAIFTFAGVDGSDAQAEVGNPSAITTTPAEERLTQEVVPTFVAKEVVQPLPEQGDAGDDQTDKVDARSLRSLVSSINTNKALTEELHCLAGAVYFESRGEPLEGQLAVAQVIINRTESRQFPSSYCGVVHQRAQFSFLRGGRMPAIRTSSGAWHRAQAIAQIAHRGLWDSAADDSLYFHAKYVRPSWSRTKLARATIDSHVFYR